MNAQDLIARVKLRLDDEAAPRAFTDSDILNALNDAQDEFAQRTLCLFDGEDYVPVTAQSPWVQLPAGTVWVTAAWIDADAPLRIVTQHELEFGYFDLNGTETTVRFSNWRNAAGTPQFLVTDLGPEIARLVARPTAGGSLFLERYRTPDAAMSVDPEVAPEIPEQHHRDLVIGALAYLFAIPNQESYNASLAQQWQGAWERRLQRAELLLQTALRIRMKVVAPPAGMAFGAVGGNTIGADQNVNT